MNLGRISMNCIFHVKSTQIRLKLISREVYQLHFFFINFPAIAGMRVWTIELILQLLQGDSQAKFRPFVSPLRE